MQECREGTFGANCKQTCHCASGGTCSKDTGECTNGCEPPHFGTNCQCSTETGVLGLDVTSGDPHQLFITFQPDACASDYELRHQCEDIASVHRVPQTFNYFLTGIESPSNYIVQVRPIYIGGVRGPEVSHLQPSIPKEPPTRVNLTLATPYSLSFSWSKPPCGSRGGIITGYTYKLTEISPESQVVIQSVTSEESVTIEGLTPLTEYSFQVAANTIAGAGPFSRVAMEATVDAGLSLAVVVGVPATIVILILLIIVTLAVYKRRRRRQNRSPWN
ncbi:receptor-type tyrosine-protein phosphatase delta-like [Acanthaster planci]|uniref:Receptor-type tyrosine-protein phosphatase delta-like n=1 Tax=Acanthaster planci TaxID=133434 RepID=A0A8B8A1D1_ACAPL|nr:receptor-type tyrosine-protein phosphatase delta-like [Acanthaster planci]